MRAKVKFASVNGRYNCTCPKCHKQYSDIIDPQNTPRFSSKSFKLICWSCQMQGATESFRQLNAKRIRAQNMEGPFYPDKKLLLIKDGEKP